MRFQTVTSLLALAAAAIAQDPREDPRGMLCTDCPEATMDAFYDCVSAGYNEQCNLVCVNDLYLNCGLQQSCTNWWIPFDDKCGVMPNPAPAQPPTPLYP